MTGELLTAERLAPAERTRLDELEQVVAAGLQTFVDVGLALQEIRNQRLYRATHGTFESYLDERWGMSRRHGYRLIDAARVAELVSPIGHTPANEAQARELVPLLDEPDLLVDVVRELRAEHGDRLTAAKLRDAVSNRLARDQALNNILASTSPEWYTPAVYVDAAREVMGGIDLDPASCAQANESVRAPRYFDLATDGLAQQWRGRVWLNPPYGRQAALFVAKLLEERAAGRVTAAVVLLNAYGFDSEWFRPLHEFWWCFTDHRISFRGPLGEGGGPTFGNVFVYLGPAPARFVAGFRRFGWPRLPYSAEAPAA